LGFSVVRFSVEHGLIWAVGTGGQRPDRERVARESVETEGYEDEKGAEGERG
jgi:hypothetical protein